MKRKSAGNKERNLYIYIYIYISYGNNDAVAPGEGVAAREEGSDRLEKFPDLLPHCCSVLFLVYLFIYFFAISSFSGFKCERKREKHSRKKNFSNGRVTSTFFLFLAQWDTTVIKAFRG